MNEQIILFPLFNALKKSDISYCVLRNYEFLPSSLNGSDLDILIAKDDISIFYKELNNVLSLVNGKILIKYGELTPRLCIAGGINGVFFGVQIDVHEGILPYKSLGMFPADSTLERSITYNGVLVANDEDANIISFFKEILNNEICSEKYFYNARSSWCKNTQFYRDLFLKNYNAKVGSLLANLFLNDYDTIKIIKVARYCRNILSRKLMTKVNNLIITKNKLFRFIKPPGYTIALLGTDGSGKTSVIDAISTPLNEAVHNALFYEHMRPNLLPNIAQLFGKKAISGPVTNPHGKAPSGFFLSLFRLFYYSIDYIFGFYIKVYPVLVKKSSIWIFDRYYYDYLFDPKRGRIKLPSFFIKFVGFFIPEPDLIICLGTEPSVIFERKPELPIDVIHKQVEELKLFSSKKQNAVWIDTGESFDKTISKVMNIILNRMSNRYKV